MSLFSTAYLWQFSTIGMASVPLVKWWQWAAGPGRAMIVLSGISHRRMRGLGAWCLFLLCILLLPLWHIGWQWEDLALMSWQYWLYPHAWYIYSHRCYLRYLLYLYQLIYRVLIVRLSCKGVQNTLWIFSWPYFLQNNDRCSRWVDECPELGKLLVRPSVK